MLIFGSVVLDVTWLLQLCEVLVQHFPILTDFSIHSLEVFNLKSGWVHASLAILLRNSALSQGFAKQSFN